MPLRSFCCVALAALLTACVGPPEDIDTVVEFEADTFMGQIQRRGELRVAIPSEPEKPLFFEDDQQSGDPAGFIVDLAEEVGRTLGVSVEYTAAPEEELVDLGDARAQPGSDDEPRFDIAFPTRSITEKLARSSPFTNPYYVAHQRILAPAGSGIASFEDLAGERVCVALLDEETTVAPDDVESSIEAIEGDAASCAGALRGGRAAAVTGRDTTLMSIWSSLEPCLPTCGARKMRYRISGDDITTEGMGATLPGGTSGWGNFVNSAWGEMEAEARWTAAHERWIVPYLLEPVEPPEMTFREAAGLYPKGL